MSASRGYAGALWHIADDGARCPLLDEILAGPDAVMARARMLKHDETTSVAVAGDTRRQWVIKRYNTKNRWHAVRRVLRTSRALNCWRAAGWLTRAGVATARPVAVIEERRWRRLRGRSYFVCEYVTGETLNVVLARGADNAVAGQAIEIVRRLRRAGIVHGDLKATNFLVSGGCVYLLDLDATRRAAGRRLEHGLRRDLERFLRNWGAQPELKRRFEAALGPGAGPLSRRLRSRP